MTEITSAIYLTEEHTELLIALFYRWNLTREQNFLNENENRTT